MQTVQLYNKGTVFIDVFPYFFISDSVKKALTFFAQAITTEKKYLETRFFPYLSTFL